MNYIKLWCEWDYGQDAVIFSNESVAKNWLCASMGGHDELTEMGFGSVEGVFDEGLAGFNIISLIEKSS